MPEELLLPTWMRHGADAAGLQIVLGLKETYRSRCNEGNCWRAEKAVRHCTVRGRAWSIMAEAESAPTEVSEGLASSQVWSELRNDIICFCFKDAGLCAVACASMSALENAMSAAIVPVPASPAQTRSNTCMEVEMEQLCRHVCAAADLNGRATRLRLMRLLLAPADVLWKAGLEQAVPRRDRV